MFAYYFRAKYVHNGLRCAPYDDNAFLCGNADETFSVFNYLACDTVLAYQGFSTGLSCAVLIRYTSLFNSIAYFNTVWFIIFKVLMLVFFIVYLNLLTRQSFELKAYSANLRARIDPKTLLYLMIIMIFGCGTAILLNSVYCIGIITI